MAEPEVKALICALADAAFAVPGSRLDHVCEKCGRRVMVSPLGQKAMKAQTLVLRCMDCAPAGWDKQLGELIGTPEEIAREISTARPNTWRQRN